MRWQAVEGVSSRGIDVIRSFLATHRTTLTEAREAAELKDKHSPERSSKNSHRPKGMAAAGPSEKGVAEGAGEATSRGDLNLYTSL